MNAQPDLPRKIEDFPEWELRADLLDAQVSLGYAEAARRAGVETYLNGTRRISDRIEGEKRIIAVIEAELERRRNL